MTSLQTGAATSEIKFLVQTARAADVCAFVRRYFDPDPHGTGPCGDEYDTSTLYFDTSQLDVFHRRGSHGRAKYRIRRYGNSGQIFLERKLRTSGLLIKRRTAGLADALSLLTTARMDHGWDGAWFHRRLLLRAISPVCQVSYRRVARTLDSADGVARLTLDRDLRVRPADGATFQEPTGIPFLETQLIVEMKFQARLPALCRRLVEEFALQTQTASKYRLGMTQLARVPADAILLAESGVVHA